jgi:hypothetical protein
MKHSPHTMLCALLIVAIYVLIAARADMLAVVAAVAYALIIGAMLWTVGRPRRHGRR